MNNKENKPIPTTLAEKNRHERDSHILFDEGPHIYTIDGDSAFTSCTTWIHSHFSHFDADLILDNIFRGRRMQDPAYKYYGRTREEIKAGWSGNEAAQLGTAMHYDIECYYNGWEVKNDSAEYGYFLKFAEEYKHLKPYRTEWMVYYKEYKLAGSIDMVFEDEDGDLWIYDWKRTKEITTESFGNKKALTPVIGHLPDSNFYHYSLQLNLYRTILEEKYDKKIKGMCLVRLHPNNYFNTYERIEVPFMRTEIAALFESR
jgi:ATP-dependent exoDNAse (exonuclease V) beta subunit